LRGPKKLFSASMIAAITTLQRLEKESASAFGIAIGVCRDDRNSGLSQALRQRRVAYKKHW
jgi:hypothetical protein